MTQRLPSEVAGEDARTVIGYAEYLTGLEEGRAARMKR